MLKIAQIGSTIPLDLSADRLPAAFRTEAITVDYFVDSYADTDKAQNIFHGSELEARHNAEPYAALILSSPEFSGRTGELSVGMYTLLQLTTAFSARYHLPVFYSSDFEIRERKNLTRELDKFTEENAQLRAEAHELLALNDRLREELRVLERLKNDAEFAYQTISNAFFWKITKPFRLLMDGIKFVAKKIPPLRLMAQAIRYWKEFGFRAFCRRIFRRQSRNKYCMSAISKERLERERKAYFPQKIKFSILVPLYNTPLPFLKEMIDSVIAQTYPNWELCLADGSDDEHANVKKRVLALAQQDKRIVYRKLEKNLGISGNTNACIDMATGDFISLFDHDDILHPSALYETMRAICDQGADYVYTDEATFISPNVNKLQTLHFKPDFAPDNLRANNYICHFSSFSREVLDKAGPFRSAYDGSQDHDMILRLTANAKHVVHISKILYYWRSHPKSVAMDINSKPYAIAAGQRAVRDSVAAMGYPAAVESSRVFPSIYRLRYRLKSMPKISILIHNRNHLFDLRRCINSILLQSTYTNYEIIILDRASDDPKLKQYYDMLKKQPLVKVIDGERCDNIATLNNRAAEYATGDFLVFLSNRIEIITPGWMEEMLMYAQRNDVAAVGSLLYFPNNTVRHAGIALGLGDNHVAGHLFYRTPRNAVGYMGRLGYSQNLSAVTSACMMIRASLFREIGGMDEIFATAYSDVDLCLRLRQSGYLIVWTPYAEAYHYENKAYASEFNIKRRISQDKEALRFRERWERELNAGDPYFNPNFFLNNSEFLPR